MKNINHLSNETIAIIRTNVRKFLKSYPKLSQYRINKVIQIEIDNPQRWFSGNREETAEESIQNYYRAVGAETSTMNGAQMKFADLAELHLGIHLKNYV